MREFAGGEAEGEQEEEAAKGGSFHEWSQRGGGRIVELGARVKEKDGRADAAERVSAARLFDDPERRRQAQLGAGVEGPLAILSD
jgi:hypothetical protein